VPKIHPLAFVDPGAELAQDVEVGPFCAIGPEVEVGPGTRFLSHVSVTGRTRIGARNLFHPFCSIGGEPQDISFRGEPARTEIGDGNTFRECVQVNRGTAKDALLTQVGDANLIMACCHIAHDCVLADQIIMANNTILGGHVRVESMVNFGGAVAVHHFVTVGRLAFIGGMTRVPKDVPPFMICEGNPARLWMVNKVGCERRGVTAQSITQLKQAHRYLFRSDLRVEEALEKIDAMGEVTAEVRYLADFCRSRLHQGEKGRLLESMRADKGGAGGQGADDDDDESAR
jgi:UDP-N-acetylglucosamine acyltransferase